MGGVAKVFKKVFGGKPPKPAAVQVAQKVTKKSQTAKPSASASKSSGLGSGSSYGGSTMMSSSQGVTEEANVGKTVLGGASSNKKKKPMAS